MVQRAANDGERRCLNPRTAIRAGLNTAPPHITKGHGRYKGSAEGSEKKSVIFIRVNQASRRVFKNASACQFEEVNNFFDKPSEKAEIWVPEIFAEKANPVLVELKLTLRKLSE